jgi:hypothetical protein
MEGMMSEQLARFGHHPDPADDYCVEVECLLGMECNRQVGFDPEPDLERRVTRALDFKAGGSPYALVAREQLLLLAERLEDQRAA